MDRQTDSLAASEKGPGHFSGEEPALEPVL